MRLFTYLIACFTALEDRTKISFEYGKFQDSLDTLDVLPLGLGFRWDKGYFAFTGETGNEVPYKAWNKLKEKLKLKRS